MYPKDGTFRSEKYRAAVAARPCAYCGTEGRSQAAHIGGVAQGKGGARKVSDARLLPLCADQMGAVGCHTKFDHHRLPFHDLEAAAAWAEQRMLGMLLAMLEDGTLRVMP